jgi:hypothetical protein
LSLLFKGKMPSWRVFCGQSNLAVNSGHGVKFAVNTIFSVTTNGSEGVLEGSSSTKDSLRMTTLQISYLMIALSYLAAVYALYSSH